MNFKIIKQSQNIRYKGIKTAKEPLKSRGIAWIQTLAQGSP